MNFPAPTETAPELTETEQKALDVVNAARILSEQASLPYTWKQTLQDVSISIPIPAGTKSKELIVTLNKKLIKVGLKGQELILQGELCKEIKVDDSTWTLGTLSR